VNGLLLAPVLALLPLSAPQLQPTKHDVDQAITAHSYASYAEVDVGNWRRDLQQALRRESVDAAADRNAAKYGFGREDMRRLVRAWVIAESRQYENDAKWVEGVRAELRALAPRFRGNLLGLSIIAEALDATTEDCSATDFDLLLQGAPDPAAAGYAIATASSCTGNYARAALAGGARGTPALIRQAEYGGLPPRDTLPLYAWLTSPATLGHVKGADRSALSVLLWQRYLTALFAGGLSARALALFDNLPTDLRAAVVSPRPRPTIVAMVDGISMTFPGEDSEGSGVTVSTEEVVDAAAGGAHRATLPKAERRHLSNIEAPILQIAEAMAVAGREDEARQLLKTLPGLTEARAAAGCAYASAGAGKKACEDAEWLPMGALPLDHLLNTRDADPYPIAEAIFAESNTVAAGSDVVCRVFPKEEYPGLCPKEINDSYFTETSTAGEELRVAEAALETLVSDFKVLRASLLGPHDRPAAPEPEKYRRATVTAAPPDFEEKPIPAEYLGPARPVVLKGSAPLPAGFQLVRAERVGNRVVAISVSQTYDPTGEVSQGGYWVHVSGDGGRHWDRPLYTGLADRFPYVVAPASRLPLISNDTLHLAVDVAEIDTASITYPPVGLRTRRRAENRFLTIPLADLRRDSDGDGLTDVAAHHLLLDRAGSEKPAPFIVGSDYDRDCRAPPSADKLALIELLGRFTGNNGAAIIEPVNRPAGKLMVGWRGAAAAVDQPVFLVGRKQGYTCLASRRLIIVYDEADLEAMKPLTPDFHALEVPHIVFNRARDRGYVRWSLGWTGGTYRLRRVNGKWQFDTIGSWIT
jgi:hypothetical protein